MECSKCRVFKDAGCFYAKGRVCKECKRDYARKYRSSRGSDAGTDDASTRTIGDGILEALHRMEEDIAEIKEAKLRVESTDANLRQMMDSILEHVCRIEGALNKACEKADGVRHRTAPLKSPSRVHVRSHPLVDLIAEEGRPVTMG